MIAGSRSDRRRFHCDAARGSSGAGARPGPGGRPEAPAVSAPAPCPCPRSIPEVAPGQVPWSLVARPRRPRRRPRLLPRLRASLRAAEPAPPVPPTAARPPPLAAAAGVPERSSCRRLRNRRNCAEPSRLCRDAGGSGAATSPSPPAPLEEFAASTGETEDARSAGEAASVVLWRGRAPCPSRPGKPTKTFGARSAFAIRVTF
jgi:hypothetical protein